MVLQNFHSVFWRVLCVVALGTLTPWEGKGGYSLAQQCVGYDGCGCVFDDGSVIDVSSLANTDGTPRFKDVLASGDLYYYSYNPCKPFNEIACSNAAVCQVDAAKTMSYQAGDYDQATWSFDGINLLVTYISNADPLTFRESIVTYVCDETATEPRMNAVGETYPTTYEMTVVTKCACKNACSGGSIDVTVEVSLSTGSIMLIIFFVVLIVYVVAGMVFNRYRRQATGVDMVPNVSFWRAIPGYIKDGFVFTTGKIRPKKSGYNEV